MNFRSEPTDLRVLLVEDDFASVSMFTDILKIHFGFEICSVNTLEEASNKLESFSPELLILDINLPDGNSINFLKELYQKGFPEFKVIFTTAYANYAVEAFRLSALDFLLKPIAPQNLIASVEKVLKNISAENYRKQLETLFLNDRQPKDKKIVLRDVGSLDSRWVSGPKTLFSGSGGLVSTGQDYLRFQQMMLD